MPTAYWRIKHCLCRGESEFGPEPEHHAEAFVSASQIGLLVGRDRK